MSKKGRVNDRLCMPREGRQVQANENVKNERETRSSSPTTSARNKVSKDQRDPSTYFYPVPVHSSPVKLNPPVQYQSGLPLSSAKGALANPFPS